MSKDTLKDILSKVLESDGDININEALHDYFVNTSKEIYETIAVDSEEEVTTDNE